MDSGINEDFSLTFNVKKDVESPYSKPYVTPKSGRRSSRVISRPQEEEALPSPLKNATFSVKKSENLCIVIKRCDDNLNELPPAEENSVKSRARKKLVLEDSSWSPSKV